MSQFISFPPVNEITSVLSFSNLQWNWSESTSFCSSIVFSLAMFVLIAITAPKFIADLAFWTQKNSGTATVQQISEWIKVMKWQIQMTNEPKFSNSHGHHSRNIFGVLSVSFSFLLDEKKFFCRKLSKGCEVSWFWCWLASSFHPGLIMGVLGIPIAVFLATCSAYSFLCVHSLFYKLQEDV